MVTERVILAAIICGTIVAVCLIGTVGDILKKRGKKNERTDNDNISL